MTDGLDRIVAEYREAARANDIPSMRRLEAAESSAALIAILAELGADADSFVHKVALKGGVLMLGEFGSPRFSRDLDFTYLARAIGVHPTGMG